MNRATIPVNSHCQTCMLFALAPKPQGRYRANSKRGARVVRQRRDGLMGSDENSMNRGRAWLAWLVERKKWLIAAVALLLAGLLLVAVRDVLHQLRYEDVINSIQAIGSQQLLLALIATAVSFAALTEFDQC